MRQLTDQRRLRSRAQLWLQTSHDALVDLKVCTWTGALAPQNALLQHVSHWGWLGQRPQLTKQTRSQSRRGDCERPRAPSQHCRILTSLPPSAQSPTQLGLACSKAVDRPCCSDVLGHGPGMVGRKTWFLTSSSCVCATLLKAVIRSLNLNLERTPGFGHHGHLVS